MKKQRLRLFTEILPLIHRINLEVDPEDLDATRVARGLRDCSEDITIFDCRNLPVGFVADTGEAALPDYRESQLAFDLPFDHCYFEFEDGFAVMATTVGHFVSSDLQAYVDRQKGAPPPPHPEFIADGDHDSVDFLIREHPHLSGADPLKVPMGERIEFWSFPPVDPLCLGRPLNDARWQGELTNGTLLWSDLGHLNYDTLPDCMPQTSGATDDGIVYAGGRFIAGVLALLDEKFLAHEILPDPEPRLSVARGRRDRTRVSAETRVLTINTGAVRKAARRLSFDEQKHCTPALHWRRGHRRVLHRGSEFETSTWVRKCLVGDPAHGFIRKDYAVVWRTPMIEAPNVTDQLVGRER